MQDIVILSNAAIKVCNETIRGLNKVTVVSRTPAQETRKVAKSLLKEAARYFETAKKEVDREAAEKGLYCGLNLIYLADNEIQKLTDSISPAQRVYKYVLDYMKNSAHEQPNTNNTGIYIPFPSPEQFLKFIKQLFSNRGI
jgi:hypothetical protein